MPPYGRRSDGGYVQLPTVDRGQDDSPRVCIRYLNRVHLEAKKLGCGLKKRDCPVCASDEAATAAALILLI